MKLEEIEKCVSLIAEAAAELRRLHEENQALRQALAQPKQEPVAWMSDHDVDFKKSSFGTYPCVPLYTAPPKREWVDLTDEEIDSVDGVEMKYIGSGEYVIEGEYEFARAILAKAKEKNG